MAKTKADLVARMAGETGLEKKKAQQALDVLLKTFSEELSAGNKISLVGFGNFAVAKRDAREGRNPQTGEKIKIPARNVVKFTPGKTLKEKVA